MKKIPLLLMMIAICMWILPLSAAAAEAGTLDEASVAVTLPQAGSTVPDKPTIVVPPGSGYSITESETRWVGENSTLDSMMLIAPTEIKVGGTYYAYVKVTGPDTVLSRETKLVATSATVKRQRAFSSSGTITVEAILALQIPGVIDSWEDITTDASISHVIGILHLTGTGGAKAGYDPEKTVYGPVDFKVTYSNPKTMSVQSAINEARNKAEYLAKQCKNSGKAGEHTGGTTSTEKTWDHRRYDTTYIVIGGPGITAPISVEESDGIYTDAAGNTYSPAIYQIDRHHIASGDYGRETTYTVAVTGWVEASDDENAPSPSGAPTDPAGTPTSPAGTPTNPAAETDAWGNKLLPEAQTEKAILALPNDNDPANSTFSLLQAKATNVTKNSITVVWKKMNGAGSYTIFANKCGKGNKYKKIKTGTGTKYVHKKLKKGTYYKFIIVANAAGQTKAVSKTIHAATSGGKVGNSKSVKITSKNSLSLKVGKTSKIKAKAIPKSRKLKVKTHRKLAYESDNPAVATVSKSGLIKAVGKGNCSVYVYAQNGVFAKVKVTVT